MPGVPSGKGCNACRKQKKKCDQVKPSCSRCARLGIDCIGAGQQRYKFLNGDRSANPSPDAQSQTSRADRHSNSNASLVKVLSRTPSNEGSLLADALVSKLQAWDDLRYHLTWTYGFFLEDIPKRLGSNAALDTAINALVCSHSHLHFATTRAGISETEALTKYNHAVKTLRYCLDDPVITREASTLCAVYILMICQGFLGAYGTNIGSHAEGAAVILRTRGFQQPEDEFERKVLLTLRGPVLFESLFSNRVYFTREQWHQIVVNELDGGTSGGKMMRVLALVPDVLERGRAAVTNNIGAEELLTEIAQQYDQTKTLTTEMCSSYDGSKLPGPPAMKEIRLYAHFQRVYGLALTTTLVYNCICKALSLHIITTNPTWNPEILCAYPVPDLMDLHNDATAYIATIMRLSEEAAPFRPLASSCFTLFLLLAWVAAADEGTRNVVYAKLIDYSHDFPQPEGKNWLQELEEVERRLFLLEDCW